MIKHNQLIINNLTFKEMSEGDVQQLKVLKLKFIEKVIEDFGDSYLPIRKNDFESINLSALVSAILKKNKEKIPEHKLREFLVSEQTLRRIFEERDKDTTFQQTTRNFLSLYVGYQNYQDFVENADFNIQPNTKAIPWRTIGIGVLGMVLLITIGLVWRNKLASEPIAGKITKVILESNKAPITARFNYKFNHLNFERAVLDYTLWGKTDSLGLDKNKQDASVCFMHPTVRTVRLVADGKVLDSTKVIIPSDGWVAGYEEIFYLQPNQWKKNGVAHISKEDLPDNVKQQPAYYSFIKKVSNFKGEPSCDDLIFETRLKNPVSEGGIICNDVSIVLTGDKYKFLLNLTQKGCSHFAYIRLGNKEFNGKNHDLTKIGVNLDEFVNLKMIFKDHLLLMYINEQLVFKTPYTDDLGKLEAAFVGFKGSGTTDFIKISDAKNAKILEEESF